MDQEKFDQHLMDYLFDELDEVTHAAMKRKIESDADCRQLEAGLRATIDVAQLPLEEPDDDLEERILVAASLAERGEPLHRKLLRSLAWAGSHAMRPQLAMAAILMLVLGSSVLLLRARPGSVAVTPVKEEAHPALGHEAPVEAAPGEPAPVADNQPSPAQSSPAQSSPAQAAAEQRDEAEEKAPLAELEAAYEQGLTDHRAGNWSEARQNFAQVAGSKSPKAPSAAYYEADATRAQAGCSEAAPKYEAVMNGYPGSAVGEDAAFALADCLRLLGQDERSRALLRSLLKSKTYADRAAQELNALGEAASTGGAVASKRRSVAPATPPKAAAKPEEPPKASPPPAPPQSSAADDAYSY